MGFFDKIKKGLSKTRQVLSADIGELFTGRRKLDPDTVEELELILIQADLGLPLTQSLLQRLEKEFGGKEISHEELISTLEQYLQDLLPESERRLQSFEPSPAVWMFVGVNGVGKTTTIAKIAQKLLDQGKTPVLAAGDTFRAAAADQLGVWADRLGVDLVRHQEGADPAAVVFDGVKSAKSKGADVLLVDTAGRLHNKENLMQELAKMKRVIDREAPDSPRETLLVLDATTGQNGLMQGKGFLEVADVSGLIVTKLDGTAKGGIALAVAHELSLPICYTGVGEKAEDLLAFEAEGFVRGLLED